ncbi:MAG: FtsX-like permease family protein [Butyrivibrio sp.]
MNFLQRIFREKSTGIIFVLGLTVSCFVLINISDLISRINTEYKALNNYDYVETSYTSYEGMFTDGIAENGIITMDNYLELITSRMLQDKVGNSYIRVIVPLNEEIDAYPANILINQNEDINLDCNEDYDITAQNGIIIGENLLEYTSVSGKTRTLVIAGIPMQVIGVLNNKAAGGIDNSIYIFWDNCDDKIKKYITEITAGDIIECTYKSRENITATYQSFTSDMRTMGFTSTSVKDRYRGGYQNKWYIAYNSIFLGAGLIFSVANCYSVAYLWLIRRKKELAVRKAFGSSNLQIMGIVLGDIIKLIVPAIFLAVVVQVVYNAIFGGSFFNTQIFAQIIIVCLGMLFISFLILIHLLDYIRLIPAAAILNEQ